MLGSRQNVRRWAFWKRAFIWVGELLLPGTNCMSAKTFVDTNVLIYAHDTDGGAKHQIAKSIVRDLWDGRNGVLSTQVLHEFYVNVTRKIAVPLPRHSARLLIESYALWCVETTPTETTAAFRIEDEARIGFWDALIVAA